MVDALQQANEDEMYQVFSGPAMYVDKIYSSFDSNNGIIRITFCESYNGGKKTKFRVAIVLPPNGIATLSGLLADVQEKIRTVAVTGTPQ